MMMSQGIEIESSDLCDIDQFAIQCREDCEHQDTVAIVQCVTKLVLPLWVSQSPSSIVTLSRS